MTPKKPATTSQERRHDEAFGAVIGCALSVAERPRSPTYIAEGEMFTMTRVFKRDLEERIRHELPHLSPNEVYDLAHVVGRLVESFQPERVYVFGSQARGEPTPDSDIDLLVVVSEADQPPHRLAQAAYRAVAPHSLALDLLVMPHDEFERHSRALASLPATVLREGWTLYAA